MDKTYRIIIGLVAVIVLLLGGVYLSNRQNGTALSGVTDGQAYNSTTTYSGTGAQTLADLRVLKVGSGTFGSVVITGAVAGVMTFYDATSTVANTEWATTTLAVIPASTAAGTYVFDVAFYKGLLVDFSSAVLAPTSTITWR